MLTGFRRGMFLAMSVLALASCSKAPQAPAQTPPDRFVGKTFKLTPAVIMDKIAVA